MNQTITLDENYMKVSYPERRKLSRFGMLVELFNRAEIGEQFTCNDFLEELKSTNVQFTRNYVSGFLCKTTPVFAESTRNNTDVVYTKVRDIPIDIDTFYFEQLHKRWVFQKTQEKL